MAGENTPNYLTAVAPLATPVDTVRNPDVDAAMGFAADPNDDPSTAFAKGLQSSLFRNSPQGRDLTEAFVKTKLSNQLASQLEERKLQLQNQYQPYDASHVTPWGAIVQVGKSGASQIINPMGGDQNDPTTPAGMAYQTYMSQMKANKAKADEESDPEVVAANKKLALAKPGYEEARANYENEMATDTAKARADYYRAAAEAKRNPPVKPDKKLTPTQQQALLTAAQAEAANVSPKDQMAGMMISKAMKTDPNFNSRVMDIYNRKVEEYKTQGDPSNAEGSAQGLMNLGSSPVFNPQQGMLDQ